MANKMRRAAGGDKDTGKLLAYFVIGGTVGAVVALLFAPKSGRELREDIADATRKGVDQARETGSQLGARAGEYYDAATLKAGDIAASAREAATRRGEGRFRPPSKQAAGLPRKNAARGPSPNRVRPDFPEETEEALAVSF